MNNCSPLSFIIATACALLAVATAQSQTRPLVSLEHAIETGSTAVALPSVSQGNVTVTPCSGCTRVTLRSTAATQYFLRKEPVSFTEFKAALATRQHVGMTLFQSRKTQDLTRVVAHIDAPTQRR